MTPPLARRKRYSPCWNAIRGLTQVTAENAADTADINAMTPDELRAFTLAEIEAWRKVVKAADIRIE